MFDHNRFPRWNLVTLDKRGSINLPALFKNSYGVGPNSNFLMRPLGDCFLCIPPGRLPLAAESERELDFAAVEYSNQFWSVSPKEVGPVLAPPLFPGDAVSNPLAASLPTSRRGAAVQDLRRVVAVNKKGFIPIPDALKEALGLEPEANVMIELMEHETQGRILVLTPMDTSSTAWSEYVKERQQAHLEEERLEQRKEQLRQQIVLLTAERTKIHGEITDMAKVRETIQGNIKELNTKMPGANNFAAQLAGAAKPRGVSDLALVTVPEKKPNSMSEILAQVAAAPTPIIPEAQEHQIQSLQTMERRIPLPMNPGEDSWSKLHEDLQKVEITARPRKEAPIMGSPMMVDGKSVPTKVIELPPTDPPLQEGHKWTKDSFFGWIQVPEVE